MGKVRRLHDVSTTLEADLLVPSTNVPLNVSVHSVLGAVVVVLVRVPYDSGCRYTEGANAALAKIPGAKARVNGEPAKLAGLLADLESIPDESVRQALRNNGGGYLNHFQFFATMCAPDIERGSTGPEGELGDAIAERFGSFAEFRDAFTKKSKSLFGSGFVYLVKDGKDGGNLAIKSFPNQDSPVMSADMPILGLDLWEHAYVFALKLLASC